MIMTFEGVDTVRDADFDELIRVEWASYEQPYSRLIRLFFPILGPGPEARAAALKESTERQLSWHKEDPTSHWIKVVNSETGKIIGAAEWHVYEENPYASQTDEGCTWYPEGEGREMANSLMGQFMAPRMKYMAKPHLFLNVCFVHPDYRRRGVGMLLMQWGMKIADDMGLESYIDALEDGVPLYETCGFAKRKGIDFDASKDESSLQWRELQRELLPLTFWPMWRPVQGKFERDTKAPWDDAASSTV